MDTSTRSENHGKDDFPNLPKVESKSYHSKMKKNNATELSGESFLQVYNKHAPPGPDPTSRIFWDLLLDFGSFSGQPMIFYAFPVSRSGAGTLILNCGGIANEQSGDQQN